MSVNTRNTTDLPSVADIAPDRDPAGGVRLPLSFAQEQLWFLRQLMPEEIIYNLFVAYRLRGPLDVAALRRSLTFVVGRHDMVRARFGSEDGTPYQVIRPAGEAELQVFDLRQLPPQERERAADEAVYAVGTTPYDLENDDLYRFRLWQLDEQDYMLWLGFHHIVVDGWSVATALREVAAAYQAILAGEQPELPVPQMSYAEHIEQQRERFEGAALEEELQYWEQALAGISVLELPTDRIRPAVATGKGDLARLKFPPELVTELRAFAQANGVSLFMVLAAAVGIVLARYTGQEDVPLGLPMLGRIDPELEDVVGMFINMVPMRADLTGDPTFSEILDRIADANLDLYEHQEMPLEKIVDRLQLVRDASRNPLFQVSVQVLGDDTTGGDFTLSGITANQLELGTARAMFDLVINFWEGAHSLRVDIGYTTDIFDPWRIDALCEHIMTVSRAAVENPGLRLSEVPLLSERERERVLAAGRGEVVELTDEPVHTAVAAAAASYPDHVAAVCRGTEMTYRELWRRSDLLARHLRGLGVQHEQIVAIAMDRDLDALVAMLGVLRAGAAFTVLDPSHPAKRLDYMLRDTATPLVITRARHVSQLPQPSGWSTLLLDTEWPAIEQTPAGEPLPEWASGSSLAYVLYTSGSTGQPKGVLIEHRALMCFLEAYKLTFDFTPESRLLQLPALTFDMSIGEIFIALILGATLVQVSPEEGQSPDALSKLMRDQRVSYAGLPPAILSVLEPEPYPDLVGIMSGADAVPAEMVNKWNRPGRRFVDLYGPTEAAIACTEYICEHTEWRTPPPIGHPELNRIMYVVDRWGNLAPVGVPGELLIGGDDGLARGYLNQPELTAEKFIPDPFRPAGKVYRSGDLVRWRPDLELDFLGRIDHQVKLRGLRIELGEIEAALLAHPQVRMAVVLLRPDSRGEKRLVGYYTAASDPAPSTAELRRHLAEELPEYMVPTAWVLLDDFPLTAARKIDRSSLPEPGDTAEEAEDSFVAPQTPTETRVAEIFAEVLSLPRVGAVDNFFELGGNSLQAMRVVSRINKSFGVKVNIRLLYGTSTVSAIATKVDGMAAAKAGR